MGYKLEDIIDIALLQELQDKLNQIYSFPSAIIDNEGKILSAVAWQDICTKFHRMNPECLKECIKSDQYILEHLNEANPAVSYECPHGLIDNATPIIINGEHLGNFFTGQFFLEEPDLEFFRNQAKKYGFDENEYLEAVKKVPIWSKEKLFKYLDFIKGFIEIIAGLGLKNLTQKQIEKEIKKKEAQYSTILQTAMNGFWLTDNELNILDVNEAYCRMSGYTKEEMLSMKVTDFEASESPEESAARAKKIFEFGEDRFESKHRRKDGSIYDVEVSIQYRHSEGGWFSVFIRDITEIKKAKEDLIDTLERLSFSLEASNAGTWDWNIINNTFIWSDEFLKVFHLPPDTVAGFESWQKALHPDDIEIAGKKIQEAIDTKCDLDSDYRIIVENNEIRWIKAIGRPYYKGGYPVRMTGLCLDITERKKAEEALRKNEYILVKAQELGKMGVWDWNIKTGELFWSDEVFRIYGLNPQKDIPSFQIVLDTLDPESKETFPKAVEDSLKYNKPFEGEYVIILPDGSKKHTHTIGKVVLDESGAPKSMYGMVQDITERKKFEEALRKSEAFLNESQRIAKMGSFRYDLRNNKVIWSEGSYRLYGFEPYEIEPSFELFNNAVHPDDAHIIGETMDELQKNPRTITQEIRILTKYGQMKWIQNTITPLVEEGRVIQLTGIEIDITERKNAEEEICKFKESIENSSDAIGFSTPEGKHYYQNKAFDEFFGDIGDNPPDSVYVDHEIGKEIFDTIQNGGTWTGEVKMYAKDKSIKTVFLRAYANRNIDGKVTALIGIHTDITEQKKTEERLIQILAAVESSSNAIGISDANGCHIYQNKALSELFGYDTSEELQNAGGGPAAVYDPEVAKDMFMKIQSGETWKGELKMITKSGHIFDAYEIADSVKDSNGNIIGLVGVITDITERKKAEEELKKYNQELEKANRELNIFNKASVGRELRMIELKMEINALLLQSGKQEKYKIEEILK